MSESTVYKPPPSLQGFLTSDAFVSLVTGPIGCTSSDTEYLTPRGWVRIDNYQGSDLVAQWDLMTGELRFDPVEYVKLPCDSLIHFHNNSLSMVLSDEHRMALHDWNGQFCVKLAQDVAVRPSKHTVPVHFTPTGRLSLTDDEIRLRVMVAADGSYPVRGRQCKVTVRRDRKKARVRELLTRCGIEWTETTYERRPSEVTFTFARPDFDKPLHKSACWYAASAEQLSVLLDECLLWDGLANHAELRFTTAKPEEADVVQFAAHATGRTARISVKTYTNNPKWRETYTVQWTHRDSHKRKVMLRGDSCTIERVPAADGFKYCFVTKTGFWLARHNGRVFITGNSGKSSAAMLKIAYHAKQMRAQSDGVRRSRAVVIRNTRQMLTDATLPTFMTWFPHGVAGSYMKTDTMFQLRFDDVECDVLFRGLDDANDVRRLLSLEVSFGVLDEFREINPDIFNALQGRLGRYPSKAKGGCVKDDGSPNKHVWGASNAPDFGSFWEEYMSNPPANATIFRQPSALSPEADWTEYLIDGYYQDIAEGKTEDWIAVYIHNEFGKSLAGAPVFRSFNRQIHLAKDTLKPNAVASSPLIIGVDAGLNPAATFGQVDYRGRLLIFDSIWADGIGALRFIREKIKPLMATKYAQMRPMVIIDPAAFQRSQTDERTVAEMFRAEGFVTKPAKTNAMAARLAAVDGFFTRTIGGEAAILIDPGCKDLIKALSGSYRFKLKTNGEFEPTPEKNHPWSDIADSLEYVALHADGGQTFGGKWEVKRREVRNVPYAW